MYKGAEYLFPENTTLVYCVVECDSICSHCLLMPFKKDSVYTLQIIHTLKWANGFLDIPKFFDLNLILNTNNYYYIKYRKVFAQSY